MPRIILDLGFLTVSANYLQRRASGLFYYYRRIPKDLLSHYGRKRFRVQSLKTADEREALKKVSKLAAADDALWASLKTTAAKDLGLTTPEVRTGAEALMSQWGLSQGEGHRTGPDAQRELSDVVDVLDSYFVRRYGSSYEDARAGLSIDGRAPDAFYSPLEREAVRLIMSDPRKPRVLLSEALTHYLEHHENHGKPKFIRDNTAYIGHVIAAAGDLPLSQYRREDANKVKERLVASGLATATVRRTLNAVSAVFNRGRVEFDLTDVGNPFEDLRIAKEGEDAKERVPFTIDELKAIADACRAADDDIRHIIAIQAGTGARSAEIVGLRIEDVSVGHAVPHLWIRPHERLGRTLKNDHSARKVPLVGVALWGATRALEGFPERSAGWLFPRYAADNDIKAVFRRASLTP